MQVFWTITAILAAVAVVAGIVYLIHGELRAHRMRQIEKRLQEAAGNGLQDIARKMRASAELCPECHGCPVLPRCPRCGQEYIGHPHFAADYSRLNVDQQLRNRSERWD